MFVIDQIKESILTEWNLRQLVELSNEQLSIDRRRIERRLDSLALVNREVETKLERLYTALESGKLDIDDLAPRLKQLRTE